MKLFNKKSIKNLGQHNCFVSIDELPIKIWFDIHKKGDYTKLLKKDIILDEKVLIKLSSIWEGIYNEFIDRFGLSEEFLADLRDEVKLANLRAEYIITGQRHYRTLIKIEEEKKRILKLEINEPADLEMILAKMSKYYGFKLNGKELTVAEYYSYIKNIVNGKN